MDKKKAPRDGFSETKPPPRPKTNDGGDWRKHEIVSRDWEPDHDPNKW